jgi:hypothetical protein
MAFILAALALLAMASHCKLEAVPGFEFLACLVESGCHGKESSHESAPEDAACCSVEKSEYRIEQFRITFPSPQLLAISSVPFLDLANALPAEVGIDLPTAAPPGITASWQFSSRTALPARAPSLAS